MEVWGWARAEVFFFFFYFKFFVVAGFPPSYHVFLLGSDDRKAASKIV